MKDTAVPVASFLRSSSKGRLKYDRYWVEEGRVEKILKVNNELTKLHHVSPRKLIQDNSLLWQQAEDNRSRLDRRSVTSNKVVDVAKHVDEETDLPTPASAVQMCLKAYEEGRTKKVQENIGRRCNLVDDVTELNLRWAEQQMEHMKQKIELLKQKRINDIMVEREKELQEVKERQEKQKEHLKTKARRLHDGKKEAEAKQRQLEELQQRKKKEQLELRTKLVEIQNECSIVVDDIVECLQKNKENRWLTVKPTDRGYRLKDMGDRLNTLFLKCDNVELDAKTIQEAQNTLYEHKSFLKDLQDDIDQAKLRREKEAEVKSKIPTTEINEEITENKEKNVPKSEKTESTTLYQYISPSNLQHYVHVIEHQREWEKNYKPLMDDASLKKYRFDLQKAVNIPVNAISRTSGVHLKDKVQRLSALLSGEMVTVGDKKVTCKSHPNGLEFCMDLLVKKLITQAEKQVPSNHEAAFPLAAVTVSLLVRFPELKLLLLAHFYIRCPYLVPYYIPQKEDQSQEEHYKALGYLYIDGTVEKQDQFLKRMGGIVRFYGAVLHTAPMPGLNASHPHGLLFGWKFFSSILNLRPRADVTATVIFDFLEVAGSTLYSTYGKQFRKLLHVLCKDYFHEIEKVTPEGSGGPLSRLQGFLQNVIRSGNIATPAGRIMPEFWNTR